MAKRHRRRRLGYRRKNRRGKRAFYKSAIRKRAEVVTSRLPMRMNMPIPPRFRTKLVCTNQGYYNALTTASYTFAVYGNRLFTPFNMSATGYSSTLFPNPLVANGTQTPCGLSNIIGANGIGPYTAYRVYASRITVRVTPSSADDLGYIAVAPNIISGTGMNVVTYGGFTTLQQAPYNKSGFFNTGVRCVVSNYMDTATLFGKTRAGIQSEDGFLGSSANQPTNLWAWVVAMSTGDQLAPGAPIAIQVQINYYVEFLAAAQAGLSDS